MDRKVKKPTEAGDPRYKRDTGRTRISAKHQVTIPIGAFVGAGFKAGDAVSAEAIGPGRVVLTRQEALLDEFSGVLRTRGDLRKRVEHLSDEWA